jgi:hypothetical protein
MRRCLPEYRRPKDDRDQGGRHPANQARFTEAAEERIVQELHRPEVAGAVPSARGLNEQELKNIVECVIQPRPPHWTKPAMAEGGLNDVSSVTQRSPQSPRLKAPVV